MFGKPVSSYFAFLKPVLIAMAIVGVGRLALSLMGANDVARFFSTTVVTLVGLLYCALRVEPSGFGGFKQLFGLMFIQSAVYNGISAVGVVLAAAGLPNVYAAPEFTNMPNYLPHVLGHVVGGLTFVPVVTWIVASIVMLLGRAAGLGRRAAA